MSSAADVVLQVATIYGGIILAFGIGGFVLVAVTGGAGRHRPTTTERVYMLPSEPNLTLTTSGLTTRDAALTWAWEQITTRFDDPESFKLVVEFNPLAGTWEASVTGRAAGAPR